MRALRILGLAALAGVATASTCDSNVGDGTSRGQETVRMSVRADGTEGSGNCDNPQISFDGRYVVFESDAEDLVVPDGNGWRDIFLKDRATGELFNLTRVPPSLVFGGQQVTTLLHHAFQPSVSADGRYVAFLSRGAFAGAFSSPGGPQPTLTPLVMDRQSGTFRRALFILSSPSWCDRDCTDLTMSDDGQTVAFATRSSNMGFANAGFLRQVYSADMSVQPPVITLVSRSTASATAIADKDCHQPRVSRDGRVVTFLSAATNLGVAAVDNRVYLASPPGAALEHVTVVPGTTTPADGWYQDPCVSGDGRYVAFNSFGTLIPGPLGMHIARVDRVTPSAISLGTDAWNQTWPAVLPSGKPFSISFDGESAAYVDNVGLGQIRVRGPGGAKVTASLSATGALAELPCDLPAISGDGRWVVWKTDSANLVEGDENLKHDIFLRGPLR